MDVLPTFECNSEMVNKAFRYAIECVCLNVKANKTGLLQKEDPCLMAGSHYTTPWTRDAAINVYNAGALLSASVSKNTLLSVVEKVDGKTLIGDQYWDKIIWTIGAYKLYQVTKDKEFLSFAFTTVKNTLEELEKNELDEQLYLFRGPAVYGDGVSAYPLRYRNADLSAGILDWVKTNGKPKNLAGYGIPMFALSTNCVYAESYRLLSEMSKDLGEDGEVFAAKAKKLRGAINKYFWNSEKGYYDYLMGESDAQETLGLALSILLDIADEEQAEKIAKNSFSTPHGVPCVYPCFEPYEKYGYGRHCGTVWPHIQGFWAMAMRKCRQLKKFDKEFFALTKNAVRDRQFAEIYHPDTGEIYGGVQEWKGEYVEWKSQSHQTWSATAYLNMIMEGIVGLKLGADINFSPYLPQGIKWVRLKNLWIGNRKIDIEIIRSNIEGSDVYNAEKYKIYVK